MSRMVFLYETSANSIHAISVPHKGRSSRFILEHFFLKERLVNRNQSSFSATNYWSSSATPSNGCDVNFNNGNANNNNKTNTNCVRAFRSGKL